MNFDKNSLQSPLLPILWQLFRLRFNNPDVLVHKTQTMPPKSSNKVVREIISEVN